MNVRRMIAITMLFISLMANAAQADIVIVVKVDNQSASSQSLVSSGTIGTFTSGPVSAVAASTNITAAQTYTSGTFEAGGVEYGACQINWTSQIAFSSLLTGVSSNGSGCSATVLSSALFGTLGLAVVELVIT